jgi:4-oxalmesaconate hydratase
MIIDAHGHISIAPEVLAYKAQIIASLLNPDQGRPKIPVERMAEYGQKHIDLLDKVGTDIQLISPRPFHAMHSLKPHKVVVEWNKYVNDVIAQTVELFPTRYIGVGGLPQGPDEPLDTAIEELERCVRDLGFVGCLINPDPAEGGFPTPPGLGDPYWYPLYEKLCELDVPAMIHVSSCCNPNFHHTGAHYINADTAAFMQFIQGDLFRDFPTLRLVIPHGGGAVPYHWGRYRGLSLSIKKKNLLEHVMNNVYFDTCVYHLPGIELLTSVVPIDNILFASEMLGAVPGIDPETGHAFDDTKRYIDQVTGLSAENRHKIFEANARRVYPRLDALLTKRAAA